MDVCVLDGSSWIVHLLHLELWMYGERGGITLFAINASYYLLGPPTPLVALHIFRPSSLKLILLPECLSHGPDHTNIPAFKDFFPCNSPTSPSFLQISPSITMQFMRNNQKNAFLAVRFMSNAATKPKKQPKLPRYSPQNQQILDDMMIPGPALRFFKTKKERRRPEGDNLVSASVH